MQEASGPPALGTPTSGQLSEPPLQALLADGGLAGEWLLDPARSTIRLRSKSMLGLARVVGVFREISGYGTVAPGGKATGTITIATASLDTQNARRDTHLRSADFFDSETHPDILFAADSIRPADEGVVVTGALTVRERTERLSFPATASVRDGEVRLDAEVVINRADFGLTWNFMGTVATNNTITIRAVFTRATFPGNEARGASQ
jgi:polyisoprenoid-binding protein YceI